MAATARRLLSLYVRPTLFAALEARARQSGLDLDVAVRDILQRAVTPPRRLTRAHRHLRLVSTHDEAVEAR